MHRLLGLGFLAAMLVAGSGGPAAADTWAGTDLTWSAPDSDSFGADTYNDGDTADFTTAGASTSIVIDAGGVAPGATHFDSTADYAFSGGDLAGGPVALAGTNTADVQFSGYTGGLGFASLTVSGGEFDFASTLLTDGDTIGVGTGTITLDGGKFRFRHTEGGAGITLTNAFEVTAAGGTIDFDRAGGGNPESILTGAWTIAGDLDVISGGGGNNEVRCDIQGAVTLTESVHIAASEFYNGAKPRISGDIGEASSHPLTLSYTAGNRTDQPFQIAGTNNTWSGGTIIEEGTSRIDVFEASSLGTGDVLVTEDTTHDDFAELTLRGKDNLADAAVLSIETGAVVELLFANDTAGAADASDMVLADLVLGGASQGPGVYNATNTSSFFTGSGEIVVVPEPATLTLAALGGLAALASRRRREKS